MQPARAAASRQRGRGGGDAAAAAAAVRGRGVTYASAAQTSCTPREDRNTKSGSNAVARDAASRVCDKHATTTSTNSMATTAATTSSSPDAWAEALVQLHKQQQQHAHTDDTIASFAQHVPLSLLQQAYRLHLSCSDSSVIARAGDDKDDNTTTTTTRATAAAVAAASAHASCAATVTCRAELQTLDSRHESVLQACADVLMGRGPVVVLRGANDTTAREDTTAAAQSWPTSVSCYSDCAQRNDDSAAAALTAVRAVDELPRVCLWRGIANVGNTCYLACVLQLLFSVAAVRRAVLAEGEMTAYTSSSSGSGSGGVGEGNEQAGEVSTAAATTTSSSSSALCASQLKEVMADMAFSRAGGGADVTALAHYLSLDVHLQQDAQECMLLLLDWLRSHGGRAVCHAIDRTFACTLLFTRTCGQCGYTTHRAQLFYSLSLPLRPTLTESLDAFVLPDSVDGVTCEDGCGVRGGVATTRPYMRQLPRVLVLHLNRFVYDAAAQQHRKRTTPVRVPCLLDLAPYVRQWHDAKKQQHKQQQQQEEGGDAAAAAATNDADDDTDDDDDVAGNDTDTSRAHVYELRGVVQHIGEGAQSGHYTYVGKVRTASTHDNNNSSSSSSSRTTAHDGTTAASFVWLEYNDAEVSDVTARMTPPAAASSSTASGKDDCIVSRDAYVLVYHRLTPTVAAAAVASSHTSPVCNVGGKHGEDDGDDDAPSARELPARLLRRVSECNAQVLHDRIAWLQRRQTTVTLLRSWATAAAAVFASSPSLSSAVAAAESGCCLTCLPTTWLRAFGRCFLPPYIDVRRLNSTVTASSATRASNNDDDDEDDVSSNNGSAHEQRQRQHVPSSSSLPSSAVTTAGGLTALLDGVQRHFSLKRSRALLCAHGRLAPWAAYKVLPAAAVTPLCTFLSQCAATTTSTTTTMTATHADGNNNNNNNTHSDDSGGGGDAQLLRPASLFELDTRTDLCAVCAVHCARTVRLLREVAVTDEAMTLLLPSPSSSSSMFAHAAATGSSSSSDDSATMTTANTTDARSSATTRTPATSRRDSNDEDDHRVLISDEVVAAWQAYMSRKREDSDVLRAAGYTGLLALWRSDASAHEATTTTTPSSLSSYNNNSHTTHAAATMMLAQAEEPMPAAAMRALHPLAAQLPAHTHHSSTTTATTSTAAATRANEARAHAASSRSSGGGSGNAPVVLLRDRLLCPHGVLRADAAVHVVHERVRLYLRKRLATLLTAVRAHDARTRTTTTTTAAAAAAAAAHADDGGEHARVDEAAVEHWLLPRIPASHTTATATAGGGGSGGCAQCVSRVIEATAARHRARLRRLTEARRFATLWLAGQLTSRDATAALLRAEKTTPTTVADTPSSAAPTTTRTATATASAARRTATTTTTATAATPALAPPSPPPVIETEEQLLQARHPNREFFRRPIAQTYRDALHEWQEGHERVLQQQRRAVAQLRRVVEQQRALSLPIRTVARRSGRGGGGGNRRGGNNNNNNGNSSNAATAAVHVDAAAAHVDPQSPEGRLAAAERVLQRMQEAPAPAFEERFGCLPTWWVARWYDYVTSNVTTATTTTRTPALLHNSNSNSAEEDNADRPPRLHTFAPFYCPHGKLRVTAAWLNPCDGFWQDGSTRRVEQLWTWPTRAAATTAATAAAAPATASSDEQVDDHNAAYVAEASDARALAWTPPLLVVPMNEYVRILRHYGAPDMLVAKRATTTTATTAAAATAEQEGSRDAATAHDSRDGDSGSTQAQQQQRASAALDAHADKIVVNSNSSSNNKDKKTKSSDSDSGGDSDDDAEVTYECAADKVVCVVQREGALSMSPPSCEACCKALLATAATRLTYFTHGSLQLQLHLRKSKRQFYDATSTLTSSTPHRSNEDGAADGGGGRGQQQTQQQRREGDANTNKDDGGDDKSTDGAVHHYTTLAQLRARICAHVQQVHGYYIANAQQLRITRTRNRPLQRSKRTDAVSNSNSNNSDTTRTTTTAADDSVESATLLELGVRDGDTLLVSLLDDMAIACATSNTTSEQATTATATAAAGRCASGGDDTDEWEAIPPELLLPSLPSAATPSSSSSSQQQQQQKRPQPSRARRGVIAAEQRAFAQTRLHSRHAAHDVDVTTAVRSNNSDDAVAESEVGVACPTCTYLNAAGMVVCEMCETPLISRA